MNYRYYILSVQYRRAHLLTETGDYDRAEKLLIEGIKSNHEMGDNRHESMYKFSLARLQMKKGQYVQAKSTLLDVHGQLEK